MRHEKSLLSKTLLTVILPVALIFFVTVGFSMVVVSQSFDGFSDIQSSLILIYVIGLAVIIGVIMLGIKETSRRITSLAETANRMADGDFEVGRRSDKPQDQLGEIAYALSLLAENSKAQSEIAQIFKINKTTIINYLKQGDTLGWCNYNAKEEIKRSASLNGRKGTKKISIIKNGIKLVTLNSLNEAINQSQSLFGVKFRLCGVSYACIHSKTYKGFEFKYE